MNNLKYDIFAEFLNYLNDDDLILHLEEDPTLLSHIKNPSKNLQMKMIKMDRKNILWLQNSCLEVQFEVVEYSPRSIEYIKNCYDETKLRAIEIEQSCISVISLPSVEMQMMAIKNNPMDIKNIINPDNSVVLAAIDSSVLSIAMVIKPTAQQLEYACKKVANQVEASFMISLLMKENIKKIVINSIDIQRLYDRAINQDKILISKHKCFRNTANIILDKINNIIENKYE